MTSAQAAVSAAGRRLIQHSRKQRIDQSGDKRRSLRLWVTHVNQVLVEAFPQVVQEGRLTGVGVQEDKVLDAYTVPSRQGRFHVPQDLTAPLLQALSPGAKKNRRGVPEELSSQQQPPGLNQKSDWSPSLRSFCGEQARPFSSTSCFPHLSVYVGVVILHDHTHACTHAHTHTRSQSLTSYVVFLLLYQCFFVPSGLGYILKPKNSLSPISSVSSLPKKKKKKRVDIRHKERHTNSLHRQHQPNPYFN